MESATLLLNTTCNVTTGENVENDEDDYTQGRVT